MNALPRRPSGDRRLLLTLAAVAVAMTTQLVFHDEDHAGNVRRAALRRGGPTGGDAREVDVDRVRRLILEGRLSDREAEHYRPLAPTAGPAGSAEPRP